MKKAIITVGLGFGDEGKGATVDALCRRLKAGLVIRYCGGCQAGHNVQLPDGRRHCFSQFGAGTLAGVPAYLGPRVIIDPHAMLREANHLQELGIENPFSRLTVSNDCLVSTVYHQAANRIREIYRGGSRHGSCGHGIGETRSYWLKYGDDAIIANDLGVYSLLEDKLELLRQRLCIEVQEMAVPGTEEHLEALHIFPSLVADCLREVGRNIYTYPNWVDKDIVVFEGAQGVLLDEWYGFHPYTTWSTVTPRHALEMIPKGCEIEKIGITRAYATRHGAGPFLTQSFFPLAFGNDPGNPENDWQGHLRTGVLDLVLLRYAVKACGGIDSLVVNHLDQVQGKWKVCNSYQEVKDLSLHQPPNLKAQERNTEDLEIVRPSYTSFSKESEFLAFVERELGSITILGRGPTYEDRTFLTSKE